MTNYHGRAAASPIVRRQRLGNELRVLREATGQAGDRVAAAMKWSPSKISRYELGRTAMRPGEIGKLLDHYGVTGEQRDALMALAVEAGARGWGDELDLPGSYQHMIALEEEAAEIGIWAAAAVPDLLQTEAYARAAITAWASVARMHPAQAEGHVQARMRRQEILTRDTRRPALNVILDESVLMRRPSADPQVMRGQLDHLIRYAASRPATRVQVLPLDAAGPGRLLCDSWTVLHVPGARPYMAGVAGQPGDACHVRDDEQAVYLLTVAFNEMTAAALDPAASMLALHAAAARWR
jgi:transcriptional regulator with XRE-family HTH domain